MWNSLGNYKEVYKYQFFVVVVIVVTVVKNNSFPSSVHHGKMLTLTAVKVPRFIFSFKQTKPQDWGCPGLNSHVHNAAYNKRIAAQASRLLSYLDFCFHNICSNIN